jgi:hypothetical protein
MFTVAALYRLGRPDMPAIPGTVSHL